MPAKLQMSRISGSIVMRPRIFAASKRLISPKGVQVYPKYVSHVLPVEISKNNVHRSNLKRNRFKFLHLGPNDVSVPKLPLLPNPYFRAEIGNSDDASPEI